MGESKSKFYYLRHHRTKAHDLEQMCGGGSDLPLNEEAKIELKRFSPAIQEKIREVQMIYTTSLFRAIQSAKLINHGFNREIRILDELREWNLGDWEGKYWKDLPHPFTFEGTPPQGETRAGFRDRVTKTMEGLIATDNNFLIVGHGIVFHEISKFLLGEPQYIETAELVCLKKSSEWEFNRLSYV